MIWGVSLLVLEGYSSNAIIVPSTTLTVTVPDAVFPAASENVYVTVLCPTAKKSPGAAVRLIRKAVPELSVAVGSVKLTSIPGVPSSTCRVILLLVTVTTGGIVSTDDQRIYRHRIETKELTCNQMCRKAFSENYKLIGGK